MYKMVNSLTSTSLATTLVSTALASTALASTALAKTMVTSPKQFIKYSKMPVCKQCSFFVPHTITKHKHELGLCKKFGEKNILSGEIKYFLASTNRNDTNRCGLSGTYFEKNNIKEKL
jgi:hypothetical protein